MTTPTTQAAALYLAHYPGGNWSNVPEHIKRVYLLAVEAKELDR